MEIKEAVFLFLHSKLADGNTIALVIVRKDGTLGFPGGKLEKDELHGAALRRECKEEIDYVPSDFKHVCNHAIVEGEFYSHLFTEEVELEVLEHALNNAKNAEYYSKECLGVTLVTFPKGSASNLLDNPEKLAPTVKEELEHLITSGVI